jgi:hypothetical protein
MNQLSRRLLGAGPLERQELIDQHSEKVADEHREATETAEENENAGDACVQALFDDAPRTAWQIPFWMSFVFFLLVLAATFAAALFFNSNTLNLSPQAAIWVGLGLPTALIILKAAADCVHIGRITELLSITKQARRGLKLASVCAGLSFVVFGFARSIGALDESISLGGLMGLELACSFAASQLLVLTLAHCRAPLHFLIAAHCRRVAAARAPFVSLSGSNEDGVARADSTTTAPTASIHRNGTAPENRPPQKGGARSPVQAGAVLVLASILAMASVARATTVATTISYYIDLTPSVAGTPELAEASSYAARSLPALLAVAPQASTVELYEWSGEPGASRAATRKWAMPPVPVADPHSLFRRRQEYLREQALHRRDPVIADAVQAISGAALEPVSLLRRSCVYAMLEDAATSRALCIIITDAFDEGCQDAVPAVSDHRFVLVVVLARGADGAATQARVKTRVQHLRQLGFSAVDAREFQALSWDSLFSSPAKSSRLLGAK